MLLNAIYFQLVLIVVTALWFSLSNRRHNIDSLLKIGGIVFLFLGLWIGGVWVYPPVSGLIIIVCVFFTLVLFHFRKPISKTTRLRYLISNIPMILILPLACFLVFQGFSGRQVPTGRFIEFDPPFKRNHGACVLSGGISPLLNFHIFPSESSRDLGQYYALDIIKIGTGGFRTRKGFLLNPKPEEIEAYEMFGTEVFSPCSGRVVEVENNLPDQPIGGSDKSRTGGNGVVLQCDNYHVHLHHMKKGSVIVELGERVESGQKLGQIGNSGNTLEPHLHLHAETILEEGNSNLHGEPIHMRFNGKFMARGDCY